VFVVRPGRLHGDADDGSAFGDIDGGDDGKRERDDGAGGDLLFVSAGGAVFDEQDVSVGEDGLDGEEREVVGAARESRVDMVVSGEGDADAGAVACTDGDGRSARDRVLVGGASEVGTAAFGRGVADREGRGGGGEDAVLVVLPGGFDGDAGTRYGLGDIDRCGVGERGVGGSGGDAIELRLVDAREKSVGDRGSDGV